MKRLLITLLLTLTGFLCDAQSLDKLREEQVAERAQIARLEAELRKVEGSQKSAAKKLDLLTEKIESRRRLKANIVAQIALLDTRQAGLNIEVEDNAYRLSVLRGEYRDLIGRVYRATLTHRVGHSAQLMNYMARTMADSMSAHATTLGSKNNSVMAEVRVVELKKSSLDRLRASYDKEVALMDTEARQAEKLSNSLQSSAGELSAEATKRKARLEELQNQIEQAIKREMSSASAGKASSQSAEPLSREFAANKGKLPSPLGASAKLASRYGVQTSGGIKINNKGIDLAPSKDRVVRSVFSGEVRRVFVIPGMGTCVMVRHGDYMTVYANMSGSSVKVGENVVTSATVGQLADSENLHFELWKQSTPLNPSEWLFNIM